MKRQARDKPRKDFGTAYNSLGECIGVSFLIRRKKLTTFNCAVVVWLTMPWTSAFTSAGNASDWVEGSATEFTIAPPRLRPESPMSSPQVSERSSLKETDEEIDVTDAGGPIMPLPGRQLRP